MEDEVKAKDSPENMVAELKHLDRDKMTEFLLLISNNSWSTWEKRQTVKLSLSSILRLSQAFSIYNTPYI